MDIAEWDSAEKTNQTIYLTTKNTTPDVLTTSGVTFYLYTFLLQECKVRVCAEVVHSVEEEDIVCTLLLCKVFY